MDKMTTGSMGQNPTEVNSVDELNRKYREEAEKTKDQPPEPNEVDKLNREYQGGAATGAAQTEAFEASINPEGGLEEEQK